MRAGAVTALIEAVTGSLIGTRSLSHACRAGHGRRSGSRRLPAGVIEMTLPRLHVALMKAAQTAAVMNRVSGLAIANYDFRASGTVAQSIRIAASCRDAGLPAELWAMQAQGPLLARVPKEVPVVEIGSALARAAPRALDLTLGIPAMARVLRQRRPAVLLSGGNHMHLVARFALELSGLRRDVRLGLRVSNSFLHRGTAEAAAQRARSGFLMRLKRWPFAGADFVVAVSAELARQTLAMAPGLTVECIENGCDVASVRRQMMVASVKLCKSAITVRGRADQAASFMAAFFCSLSRSMLM